MSCANRHDLRSETNNPLSAAGVELFERANPVLDIAPQDEGSGASFYGPELPGLDLRIDVGAAKSEGGAEAVHREGFGVCILLHRLMLRHRFLMNLECETQPMMLAKVPTRQQLNICGSIIHNAA